MARDLRRSKYSVQERETVSLETVGGCSGRCLLEVGFAVEVVLVVAEGVEPADAGWDDADAVDAGVFLALAAAIAELHADAEGFLVVVELSLVGMVDNDDGANDLLNDEGVDTAQVRTDLHAEVE
jgi:hypothetical protein